MRDLHPTKGTVTKPLGNKQEYQKNKKKLRKTQILQENFEKQLIKPKENQKTNKQTQKKTKENQYFTRKF